MRNLISKTWPFLVIITIFLLILGYYLALFDRETGHIIINDYHNDFFDSIFPFITYLGDGITAIIIILFLFFWRVEYGILAVIAFGFTAGITHGLKFFVYVDVERPFLALWQFYHGGNGHLVLPEQAMRVANSFPSGHTTSAMSIFCILTLITEKKNLSILFAILAILASTSRIYLSQHFVEDVFAGTFIGVLGTLLIFLLLAPRLKTKFKNIPSPSKRVFDLISSLIVFILGLPFFILIALLIVTSSKGGIFFTQKRVGKGNQDFDLYKFRTMKPNSEKLGQITVGGKDPRITKIGYFLRKYKLDELPQLLNVIKGDMSIVGPRPEVRKYVNLYNAEQMKVLTVKPGLTDFASIIFLDENELLGKSSNPDETYINEIMPAKLKLNLRYINKQSFKMDMKLIFGTIGRLFR
jgi:lipopolysaccharide/colanic/teichoic acid biosynthesis glycosyltransferase